MTPFDIAVQLKLRVDAEREREDCSRERCEAYRDAIRIALSSHPVWDESFERGFRGWLGEEGQ